jgi:hypothetical protein
VGKYSLRAKVGNGATSTVFLGVDDATDQKYAVKRFDLRQLARTAQGAGLQQLQRELGEARPADGSSLAQRLQVVLDALGVSEATAERLRGRAIGRLRTLLYGKK